MAAFVADLRVGDEAVPLDRVLAVHLGTFEDLCGVGLTWRSIAALVSRAGGRRRDGGLISADQLRTSVARLVRRRKLDGSADKPRDLAARNAPKADRYRRPVPKHFPLPVTPDLRTTPVRRVRGVEPSDDAKTVSTTDIDAALKRIRTV